MSSTYLRFLQRAIDPTGLAHNRMAANGMWTDEPAMGGWWGRAVWASGVSSIHAADASTRRTAGAVFRRAARRAPITLHTGAFAALGAGAVLLAVPARWIDGVRIAWAWFEGDNDSGVPMADAETGAGFDGLEPAGRNLNRGAESTSAALATWQLARRFLLPSAA